MAFTVGLSGLISSTDTGKDLHYLINTGTRPYSATIQVTSENFDVTGFVNIPPIATDQIKGLTGWSGSFVAKYPKVSPASGHTGLVTFANGYTLGSKGFSITAAVASFDVTSGAVVPPVWMEHTPAIYSFTGSYDALVDDTTAISVGSVGAATFRLSTESTNHNELAGNIIITGANYQGSVGDLNRIQYSFVVDGNLTTDGDSSFLPVTTPGTPQELTRPDITQIVVRASGARTYSGSAFVTGWTIGSTIGSAVEGTVNFQGTGALAIG